jgi:hypothetical protein
MYLHTMLATLAFTLTLITPILATPPPKCPTMPHSSVCLKPNTPACVDIYTDPHFRGSSLLNQCHDQNTCINLPSEFVGKVSSFKKVGATGLNDMKETMLCAGWSGRDCKGEEGLIAYYTEDFRDVYISFENEMVSYKCWIPERRE